VLPLKDDIPTARTPVVTIAIISLNVLVFLYQLSLGPQQKVFIYALGVVPFEIINKVDLVPRITLPLKTTIFTSMFIHGGVFHIFSNMLYLWIFGNNVEDTLGRPRFILFYLLCGVTATYSQIYMNPQSRIPMVGASGAISGILAAYLLLYPHARILTVIFLGFFIQVVRVPAIIVLSFWIIVQLISGTAALSTGDGGVAWFAHIGGFLAGLIFLKVFLLRGPRPVPDTRASRLRKWDEYRE
jgi:membrane associated rhomboid family serine protease